jgi:hypothetical protein
MFVREACFSVSRKDQDLVKADVQRALPEAALAGKKAAFTGRWLADGRRLAG